MKAAPCLPLSHSLPLILPAHTLSLTLCLHSLSVTLTHSRTHSGQRDTVSDSERQQESQSATASDRERQSLFAHGIGEERRAELPLVLPHMAGSDSLDARRLDGLGPIVGGGEALLHAHKAAVAAGADAEVGSPAAPRAPGRRQPAHALAA